MWIASRSTADRAGRQADDLLATVFEFHDKVAQAAEAAKLSEESQSFGLEIVADMITHEVRSALV